jgi:pyruvate formate lyase activating enzyme
MYEQIAAANQGSCVREAILQQKVDRKIRCNVCERRCMIVDGGLGWCRTRQNRAGNLITLTYGAASSLASNPIEKKPFYHFWPGTGAFTVGSWSCNFGCPWCQNWDITKGRVPDRSRYVSPEKFVAMTEESGCAGTSISFNEPTLSLEWSLDVFRLARDRRLYNTYVTNGYMTPEALELLIEAGLNAMNVDIKGDAVGVRHYCKGIAVEKVWEACKVARQRGVHIEITTLIIPTVNDADQMLHGIAQRIVSEFGPDVPWHVSAYFPAYRFHAPPTPVQTLERAWEIGRRSGLEFVYAGNVPGHPHDQTYCPGCNTMLIKRMGFDVLVNHIRSGRCPNCEREIAGVWKEGKRWSPSAW